MGSAMRVLSISKAWEETKAVIAADGRLMYPVALALIGLPVAVGALLLAAFAFTWHNLVRSRGWPERWW